MQFTINSDLDPDGSSLRPLLEAHFEYERMSAAKSRYLDLLAVVAFLGMVRGDLAVRPPAAGGRNCA